MVDGISPGEALHDNALCAGLLSLRAISFQGRLVRHPWLTATASFPLSRPPWLRSGNYAPSRRGAAR